MPDTKITALTAISTVDPAVDVLPIVDVSDTTMAASGTTKKITSNQILGAGGTATLASATITGDLTVNSNVNVGASPAFYGGKIATNGSVAIAGGNYLKLWNSTGTGVAGINAGAADTLTFSLTNAFTTAMTLNSTGLGVGTTTPTNKLEVVAPAGDNIVSTFRSGDATAANNAGGGFRSISSATAANRVAQVWLDADGANFSGGDYFIIQKNGNSGTVEFNQSSNAAMVFLTNSTEQMRLNSTGLGVGTSPAANSSLTVYRANSNSALRVTNGPSANNVGITLESLGGNVVLNNGNGPLEVSVGGSLRATIDTSGNVGIGVTPANWATIKALQVGAGASLFGYSATEATLSGNTYYNAGFKYVANGQATQYQQQIGEHRWFTAPSGTAGNAITFTQAMTLDASGNLLVGTTTAGAKITALAGASGQAAIFQQPAQNFWCVLAHNQATSGDNSFVLFGTEASFTSRGSITYNRAAGQVSYNITSDYRLKEDVKPLTGALNRISSLKPSTYKFKETGFTCEGFIAHELAEVIPAAVTGEKDAVNEDGSIKAQGVDLSKVVPILVAAIQELAAEVNALKNA